MFVACDLGVDVLIETAEHHSEIAAVGLLGPLERELEPDVVGGVCRDVARPVLGKPLVESPEGVVVTRQLVDLPRRSLWPLSGGEVETASNRDGPGGPDAREQRPS